MQQLMEMEVNLSVAPSTFCRAWISGPFPQCGIVHVLCLAINVPAVTVLSVGSTRLDFSSTVNWKKKKKYKLLDNH